MAATAKKVPTLLSVSKLIALDRFYTNELLKQSMQEYEDGVKTIMDLYKQFTEEKKKGDTRCFSHLRNLRSTIEQKQERLGPYNKHTYQNFQLRSYLKETWLASVVDSLSCKRRNLLIQVNREADSKEDAAGKMSTDNTSLAKAVSKFNEMVVDAYNQFICRYKTEGHYNTYLSESANTSDGVTPCDCNNEQSDIKHFNGSRPVCTTCGIVVGSQRTRRITSVGDIYKLYPSETSLNIIRPKIRYKRLNHFKETMKQLQGFTVAAVPADVITKIRFFLKQKDIKHSIVEPFLMREILHQIKLSKYYEHSVSIATAINKTFKPVRIEPKTRMQMLLMFLELERVFPEAVEKSTAKRKNFISYHFTLSRICMLLGKSDISNSARMLKSSKLHLEQESIWNIMCSLLNWPSS